MIKINDDFINPVSAQAKSSPRKRMNYNFHKLPEDTLQRMLNAMEPGTYVRPHKHENPDKREVFFVLRGSVAVVEFDTMGNITDWSILDASKGSFAAEIAEKVFHTVVCLEPVTVSYEIKDGPYLMENDKNFASWAPEENSETRHEYLEKILRTIS